MNQPRIAFTPDHIIEEHIATYFPLKVSAREFLDAAQATNPGDADRDDIATDAILIAEQVCNNPDQLRFITRAINEWLAMHNR